MIGAYHQKQPLRNRRCDYRYTHIFFNSWGQIRNFSSHLSAINDVSISYSLDHFCTLEIDERCSRFSSFEVCLGQCRQCFCSLKSRCSSFACLWKKLKYCKISNILPVCRRRNFSNVPTVVINFIPFIRRLFSSLQGYRVGRRFRIIEVNIVDQSHLFYGYQFVGN